MKRYRFVPVWESRQTEEWLSQTERDGYRLEKVSLAGHCFHFKQSKPREAEYFRLIRDYLRKRPGIDVCRSNAQQIGDYLRITNPCDLSFYRSARLSVIYSNLWVYLTLWLLLTPVCVGMFLLKLWIGAILLSLLAAVGIGYHVFGLCIVGMRIRRWNRQLKHPDFHSSKPIDD